MNNNIVSLKVNELLEIKRIAEKGRSRKNEIAKNSKYGYLDSKVLNQFNWVNQFERRYKKQFKKLQNFYKYNRFNKKNINQIWK